MNPVLNPVLTGELTYLHDSNPVRDGHPDPLREWTEDGDVTPEGWYAVRAWTKLAQPLYLIREVNGDLDGSRMRDTRSDELLLTGRFSGAPLLARYVWWTLSPELACEVARQLHDGERLTWQVDNWAHEADKQTFLSRKSYGIGFYEIRRFRPWTVVVYQRDGHRAKEVRRFQRTQPHKNPDPWEDGYRPPMKTWGSPDQDADDDIRTMDGRRIR